MTVRNDGMGSRLDALKSRQQVAWSSGNYALIGTTLQMVGESLAEAVDVRAGERVLDVAAGNGNFTLAAARRGCDVIASDYVPSLLHGAARRAEAEQLVVSTVVADAENLPFADGWFDVVGSTFGVMFTPNQERAAREMLRVCRSGGRIGLANWTPGGFIGRLFKVIGEFVPPPPDVRSPALWGSEGHLKDLFGADAASIRVTARHHDFRYRSVEGWLDAFRTWYGPMLKAFEAVDAPNQKDLMMGLTDLARSFNRAEDTSLCAKGEYLEVVISKR